MAKQKTKTVKKIHSPRIMGIVGAMGAGKTLFASALALRLKDNYFIMANYDLKVRDCDITPENVGRMMFMTQSINHRKLVVLDEFHIFSDSRSSTSRHNKLMSYFITQTRKQDIQLIYTTQQFGQVDLRVRDNTDILAIPKYLPKEDRMLVYFMTRDWFSGKFQYSHTKSFKGLSSVFGTYDTKQLIGDSMIQDLLDEEADID